MGLSTASLQPAEHGGICARYRAEHVNGVLQKYTVTATV